MTNSKHVTAALLIDCWANTAIVPTIVDYLTANPVDVVILASYTHMTSPLITDYCLTHKFIEILALDELESYIQTQAIGSIHVMGTAWLSCLHLRPVGINALVELQQRVPFEIRTSSLCAQGQSMGPLNYNVEADLAGSAAWQHKGSYYLHV
jgi:hypothetical protein